MSNDPTPATPAQISSDRFNNLDDKKKARILDVIEKHAIAHGYRCMSTNDIASEAKISKGALFSYFASKELIFAAAVERVLTKAEPHFIVPDQQQDTACSQSEAIVRMVHYLACEMPEFLRVYRQFRTWIDDAATGLDSTATTHAREFASLRDRSEKFLIGPLREFGRILHGEDWNPQLAEARVRLLADFIVLAAEPVIAHLPSLEGPDMVSDMIIEGLSRLS